MNRSRTEWASAAALLVMGCSQPVSRGSQEFVRAQNLAGVSLSGASLARTDLASPNLGGTHFAGADCDAVHLAGKTLAGKTLDGTSLATTYVGATALGGSNIAGGHLMGNDLAGTNLGESTLGTANAAQNIHGIVPADGLLHSGEDRVFPSSGRCVVVGLGSTAFPKLLAQNAGTTFHAAIGKLPWGFAATRGGAMALQAWEVPVWGSNTYCVFVVASPMNATWMSVHDFVSSVFRWNAAPSKTIHIGAIAGSPGAQPSVWSHEGAMEAGAKVRLGAITEKDFVAGELAFVTARATCRRRWMSPRGSATPATRAPCSSGTSPRSAHQRTPSPSTPCWTIATERSKSSSARPRAAPAKRISARSSTATESSIGPT